MSKLGWLVVASSFVIGISSAAADGGGGGGMSMPSGPSASAPRYDPVVEYAKGVAALQASNYKVAATAFDHVTDMAPKDDNAWRMLGAAQAGAGNWKGARTAYQRVIKLKPNDAAAHAGLGVAMARLKDAKAQDELNWLKAQSTSCANACPDAARLGALTKEVESALAGVPAPQVMLQAPRSVQVGDARYLQAVELINDRRYDQALASLNEASEAFGPHPDILTYKGYVWRKKGDIAQATSFYEQALAIAPDHRGATEYYGELKVAVGDTAGARRMLARLERLCTYGCAQTEELRRWIDHGGDPQQP